MKNKKIVVYHKAVYCLDLFFVPYILFLYFILFTPFHLSSSMSQYGYTLLNRDLTIYRLLRTAWRKRSGSQGASSDLSFRPTCEIT